MTLSAVNIIVKSNAKLKYFWDHLISGFKLYFGFKCNKLCYKKPKTDEHSQTLSPHLRQNIKMGTLSLSNNTWKMVSNFKALAENAF